MFLVMRARGVARVTQRDGHLILIPTNPHPHPDLLFASTATSTTTKAIFFVGAAVVIRHAVPFYQAAPALVKGARHIAPAARRADDADMARYTARRARSHASEPTRALAVAPQAVRAVFRWRRGAAATQ